MFLTPKGKGSQLQVGSKTHPYSLIMFEVCVCIYIQYVYIYIITIYIYAWVCYSLIFSREHRSYFWDIFLDGQCRPSRQPSRLSHAPLARASCYWWRRNDKAAAPRAASPMARRDEDWDERLKLGVSGNWGPEIEHFTVEAMAISYNWWFQWDEKHSINGVFLVLITGITRAITVVMIRIHWNPRFPWGIPTVHDLDDG